jgi:hypothetical protein
MIDEPTTYPTFYNQTVADYKNNVWNSLKFEITIGIASVIFMLFICINLIEKFLSWRESIRERIVPIDAPNPINPNPINIV